MTGRTTEFERGAIATAVALVIMTMLSLVGQGGVFQRPPIDGRPLTYFIAEGPPRSGYQPSDRELAVWAFEAWARTAAGGLTVQAAPERDALVRLYWAPPDAGTFGEMRPLTVNGKAGAELFVRADVEALGPDLALRSEQDTLWRDTIVYLTCVHEIGHALGLSHTADYRDIMYFFGYGGDIVNYFARYRRGLKSRQDIRAVAGVSEADAMKLRALHPAR